MANEEVWLPVVGWEKYYEVSNKGRVRSLGRSILKSNGYSDYIHRYKPRLLKPSKNKNGYMEVKLSKHSKSNSVKVHRLVAEAFIENTGNKPQVNHKNSDRADNNIHNLEWVTASENSIHAWNEGKHCRMKRSGEKAKSSKLKEVEVVFIKHWLQSGYFQKDIASTFSVSTSLISAINNGIAWSYLDEVTK